ncbi:MAG: class I SAM-dependent rRNA methyltransferase [Clostridia bacterium]|nr:class I SAM-dependent rRNA methyltransferase [Clostridia bacterium]
MIVIKRKFKQNYKTGFPILLKEAILGKVPTTEGDIVQLVDDADNYLCTAYVGYQNKGLGWVLTYDSEEKINYTFFYKAFQRSIELRQKFYNSTKTNAFRIFNGEGDGIGGLTIDYFDGYYMFNWYNKGIYQFKDKIMDAFMNVTSFKGIYEKRRFEEGDKALQGDAYVCGEEAPTPLVIMENGNYYALDFNDGGMVGLFLDQRDVRNCIQKKYASGKSVLNMFSYTGGFSIAAAVGGANRTVSVDVAKRSLEWTQENLYLNDLSLMSNEIIITDVFDYFDAAYKADARFDLIVLDPPSHSKTKKKIFSVEKDYVELINKSVRLLNKEGVIVASTNHSGLSREKFMQQIEEGFKAEKASYKVLEEFRLPEDFRVNKKFEGSNYLKVIFVQKG